jgi:hypothetical protein
MPKNALLFAAYPDSSSHMRGQGRIASSSPLFAIKKFSIYKEGSQWKATTHKPHVFGHFTLKVPKSLLRAKKHYVYRFDVNEVQVTAECHQVAAFTEMLWAVEYMNNGEVRCEKRHEGLCPHNHECKQLRPKIVDDSLYWEVGYFVISNTRLIFSEHTYRFTAPQNILLN